MLSFKDLKEIREERTFNKSKVDVLSDTACIEKFSTLTRRKFS